MSLIGIEPTFQPLWAVYFAIKLQAPLFAEEI